MTGRGRQPGQWLAGSLRVIELEMWHPFPSLFLVRGDSMRPTLRDGDLILTGPAPNTHGRYERGSVVAAHMPAPGRDSEIRIGVKRVVGLPGEFVRVRTDGSVWIEGELLREPYLKPEDPAEESAQLSWLCGDDEYILLGDNRAGSWDSRTIGAVPATQIVGKVWLNLPTHLLSRPARRCGKGPVAGDHT